jgi:tRNA(Ser,Leu) C12 N-acetylase TAN1
MLALVHSSYVEDRRIRHYFFCILQTMNLPLKTGKMSSINRPSNKHKREDSQTETGRKRKKVSRRNPSRGGPGFLLTCEVGREVKCAREAQDIISYYHYHHSCVGNLSNLDQNMSNLTDTVNTKKNVPLSLDEEISLLREGTSVEQLLAHHDGIDCHLQDKEKRTLKLEPYETGCRGVVVLLLPNQNHRQASVLGEGPTVEHSTTSSADFLTAITVDPVSIVTRVIKDIYTNEEKESPRSRFITRMIPVQTTCFANLEEISRTAKQLIDSYFPGDTQNQPDHQLGKDKSNANNVMNQKISFEIIFKRRLCSSVTRNECIDAVARHFDDNCFKVDLKNPEYTFIMEVCKSLVCMCLVHDFRSSCHNFNLFQISEKAKEYLMPIKSNDATDDE